MTTQDCSGCGATPCDCYADYFGYWANHSVGPVWQGARNRAHAVDRRVQGEFVNPSCPRGPVQRKNEPNPFEKAEAEGFGVWVVGPNHPNGRWCNNIDHGLQHGAHAKAKAIRGELSNLHPGHTYEVRPYAQPDPKGVASGAIDASNVAALLLTEGDLARLLFQTDETVREAIDIADDREGGSFLIQREGAYALSSAELLERAWLRNEGKRRMWAETIAAKVFARARHNASKP